MKRGKSIIALMLAAAMTLCACGADTGAGQSEKSLYDHGLELAVLLDEMVGNETYMQLHTASDEITAITEPLAGQDHGTPAAVYQISATEEGNQMRLQLAEMADLDALPEKLRNIVEQKMYGALATQINALAGAATLAATSVCTAGKTFVNSEITGPVSYLYTYEDAVPVLVSFSTGEDSTVSASAAFLLYEELPSGGLEELAAFFAEIGMEVAEVEA